MTQEREAERAALIDASNAGHNAGRLYERLTIVEWLNGRWDMDFHSHQAIADAIERGDHLMEKD